MKYIVVVALSLFISSSLFASVIVALEETSKIDLANKLLTQIISLKK